MAFLVWWSLILPIYTCRKTFYHYSCIYLGHTVGKSNPAPQNVDNIKWLYCEKKWSRNGQHDIKWELKCYGDESVQDVGQVIKRFIKSK